MRKEERRKTLLRLPFQPDADLFSSYFGRKSCKRRASLGKLTYPRCEVEAVAVIDASNLLAGELTGLEIRSLMGTLARKGKILPVNVRQHELAASQFDGFHLARSYLSDAGYRNITNAHGDS
jgi:hypothetical protein